MRRTAPRASGHFELEVSLREIRPRIWRRFLLRADATFEDLHQAIQDAFGWTDTHLWEFSGAGRNGARLAAPKNEEFEDLDAPPEAAETLVASYFTPKGPKKCLYAYDFGDGWEHEVVVKGRAEGSERFERRLLAGARACPPEDCGGVGGYEACCAFVATGEHPWHDSAEFAEWLGPWRPDGFDLDEYRSAFDR